MYFTHTTSKNRLTLCKAERLQSFLQFGPQIRILPHRIKGFGKTKISIRLIIPRQVPVQQSSIGLAQVPAYCTVSFKSICRSGANPEKVLRIRGGSMQVYYHNQ